MKKMMFFPLMITVCILMIACSFDKEYGSYGDETITTQEAELRIKELSEDYGVKVKTTMMSDNFVWHESDLKKIESIIKGLSHIKGHYQLKQIKREDGKMQLVQIRKSSRVTRITLEEERSNEGEKGYSWDLSQGDNPKYVYSDDFKFDCTFSALWTVNKYGWTTYAEVSSGLYRVEGSGGADWEDCIKEEGMENFRDDCHPTGGYGISFDGDLAYYVITKNGIRVEADYSYSGMCSVQLDSIKGDKEVGSITWFETTEW